MTGVRYLWIAMVLLPSVKACLGYKDNCGITPINETQFLSLDCSCLRNIFNITALPHYIHTEFNNSNVRSLDISWDSLPSIAGIETLDFIPFIESLNCEATFTSNITVKIFRSMPNLKWLSLSRNYDVFPTEGMYLEPNAFKETSLEYLDASFNYFRFGHASVWAAISGLSLRVLKLDNTYINFTLSKDFWNGTDFSKLEELTLWGNKITGIEKYTFVNFTNLRLLDLSQTWIGSSKLYSEAFFGLYNLRTILLYYVSVGVFDFPICENLPKLENFIAADVYTAAEGAIIRDDIFKNCSYLKEIDLSHSMIKHVSKAFSNLPSLERLDLSQTGAVINNLDAFENDHKLVYLDLAYNGQLAQEYRTSLQPGILNISSLQILNVSHNYFSTFSTEDVKFFDTLKELRIEENLFNCECDTMDFINWFKNATVIPNNTKPHCQCSFCWHCHNESDYYLSNYVAKNCPEALVGSTFWKNLIIGGILVFILVSIALILKAQFCKESEGYETRKPRVER